MEPNRRETRRISMRRFLIFGLLAALLGAACSPSSEPGPPAGARTPDPHAPVVSTPEGSRTSKDGAIRVASRINLEDPKPVPWDRYELLDGGIALDLYYWSGVEECYGFDHPEVIYGRKRIVVTLYEGRVPEADACIELAVRKVVEVALGEPVGDRKVVDGAKD